MHGGTCFKGVPMGKAIYFEVKEASTNSANIQDLITFTIPTPSPVVLKELSILPDSAFTSYGTFSITVAGQTQITTPQRLRNSLTIPFWTFEESNKGDGDNGVISDFASAIKRVIAVLLGRKKGIMLMPNEKVEIKATSDGTNTVLLSCSLVGEVVSDV